MSTDNILDFGIPYEEWDARQRTLPNGGRILTREEALAKYGDKRTRVECDQRADSSRAVEAAVDARARRTTSAARRKRASEAASDAPSEA